VTGAVAIHALFGLAVTIAIGHGGRKRASELMTDLVNNLHLTGADDTPADYGKRH
jgi:hypothetical protein